MEKYRYAGGGLVGPDNKDKTSKAAMIDYQFVSFDILTYFYSNLTFMCKTINCLV